MGEKKRREQARRQEEAVAARTAVAEWIDRIASEDPDDRATREAHGFAYEDDWQDETVTCAGCGETYLEIVAGKIRVCSGSA